MLSFKLQLSTNTNIMADNQLMSQACDKFGEPKREERLRSVHLDWADLAYEVRGRWGIWVAKSRDGESWLSSRVPKNAIRITEMAYRNPPTVIVAINDNGEVSAYSNIPGVEVMVVKVNDWREIHKGAEKKPYEAQRLNVVPVRDDRDVPIDVREALKDEDLWTL